ncbi:helix-turn-helix domain-containing protein [Brevibacillus laterosporus]|uniref:helix-turn-helix domain-containing protein n=1 Tax=Brevibacillus laterosporus TaxID=1465 RepID=UPI001F173DC7|nr:helix-turn-helix transcriptional regulator [Brevibacillus laterosporus]
MDFGKYLKNIRESRSLSVRELAKRSDVSHSHISQIETGQRGIPKPDTIKKLADGLNIPFDELMQYAGYIEQSTYTNQEEFDSLNSSSESLSKAGQRIKLLRETRKWSQLLLSEKLGINNSVLSRIEAGKRDVEDYLLNKAADIFDVTSDYLLGRTNDPSPNNAKYNDNDSNIGLAFSDGGETELTEEEELYLKESLMLFRRMKEKRSNK